MRIEVWEPGLDGVARKVRDGLLMFAHEGKVFATWMPEPTTLRYWLRIAVSDVLASLMLGAKRGQCCFAGRMPEYTAGEDPGFVWWEMKMSGGRRGVYARCSECGYRDQVEGQPDVLIRTGQLYHPPGSRLVVQLRARDFVHNGGWYNAAGEKLGFGDLTVLDMLQIALEIDEGEMFIILPERASFWNFVSRPGVIGSMAQTMPDVDAPGVEYVAEHAMFAIVSDQIFVIDHSGKHEEGEEFEHPNLGAVTYLRREQLKAMMTDSATR